MIGRIQYIARAGARNHELRPAIIQGFPLVSWGGGSFFGIGDSVSVLGWELSDTSVGCSLLTFAHKIERERNPAA